MKFAYRKIHPFKKRAYNAKRRARKYNASGEFTRQTIENLYCRQRGKCAICKEYLNGLFEVDILSQKLKFSIIQNITDFC